MDSKFYDTFCPVCDRDVQARLVCRREVQLVMGERVEHDAVVAICPHCGEPIGDSRVDQQNFELVDRIYRERHGIPSPTQLKALRAQYGMSVREFSRFLGFGEQTYATYERGAIPDELHARMIKLARTREGARCLIPLAEGSISEKSMACAQAFAWGRQDNLDEDGGFEQAIQA